MNLMRRNFSAPTAPPARLRGSASWDLRPWRNSTGSGLPAPSRSRPASMKRCPISSSPRPIACPTSTAGGYASVWVAVRCSKPLTVSPSPMSMAMTITTSPAPTGSICSGTISTKAASSAGRPASPSSGLDEVSFHMSGTEAVMQAVRLARYHTGRRKIVRFCGAYHGWWGDVQPGIGNPIPADDSYTLADLSEASLKVLATRRDIACVLVNPLQSLHPNQSAPADSALVDGAGGAAFDRAAYAQWLGRLRQVCCERGIVLIFDEVFVGFRLAPGGAQDYFGVKADMVTYGKTLGGGLPVGVVCGRRQLMRRYRAERPVDVCFARGTFNSHPYVMGAMSEFLESLERPEVKALYANLDQTWNDRADTLNRRLAERGLPVKVANLSTIWTVVYRQPSRYHWMLQYYLRSQGLALSWVGTGRLIFSLNYTAADFDAVADRFVAAAEAMRGDGWWWEGDRAQQPRASIKRQILKEMLQHRFRRRLGAAPAH